MLYEIFVAASISIIMLIIFLFAGRRRFYAGDFVFFFILMFALAWASMIWIVPYGPPIAGIFWLPSLIVTGMFALLLISFIPGRRPRNKAEAVRMEEQKSKAERVFGWFFWVLLIVIAASIAVRYLSR